MMPLPPFRGGLVVRIPALVALVSPLSAAPLVWDNSSATGAWSTGDNWDTNIEPTAADDVTFPLGLGGTITTTTTENALSLVFNDAYSLSGGTLALASDNSIGVADGVTATINNALNITGRLSKTGSGTLVLGGSNTVPGGTAISAGRIRAASAGALGTTGIVTTVQAATTLEVASGVTLDQPITLMDGGTVAGLGTAINNGKITIHAAAAAVSLATDQPDDVFSVGNGENDVTGGSGSTVVRVGGPGTVRLGWRSNFDGSWYLPEGRLEVGAGGALGDQATSVTLAGGTLSARTASSSGFGGPAENLVVTADSRLLSDRTSIGTGLTHTLGALSMGSATLTVEPGESATSGTAGIVLGNVVLSGDPVFAIHNKSGATGKLAFGALIGGGQPRAISKSGAGILSVTGGATSLPAGSTFSASGGGTVEMDFAPLGSNATVPVTSAQNPFGDADLTLIDTKLRMLARGSGGNSVQSFVLPTQLTLGGSVTLDPDFVIGFGGSNKTFELGGMSLQPGSVLSMSGDNLHGIRLTTPLVLQGNAVLKGTDDAGKDGLLTLAGGIDGNATSSIVIGGGRQRDQSQDQCREPLRRRHDRQRRYDHP